MNRLVVQWLTWRTYVFEVDSGRGKSTTSIRCLNENEGTMEQFSSTIQ